MGVKSMQMETNWFWDAFEMNVWGFDRFEMNKLRREWTKFQIIGSAVQNELEPNIN